MSGGEEVLKGKVRTWLQVIIMLTVWMGSEFHARFLCDCLRMLFY